MRATAAGLLAGTAGAAVSAAITRVGVRTGPQRWQRSNHAGEPVTLLEGPAVAAGALTAIAWRSVADPRADARRTAAAEAIAVAGSAAVGAYDDLAGSTQAKGFAGHLGALRQGRITSGMIKMTGIGCSALAAAVIGSGPAPAASRIRRLTDIMINTGLIAGTANLTNLLDLRPGRAAKMIIALGTPLQAVPVVSAAAGALGPDLAGRSMLGDTGANALGAGLAASAIRLPRGLRVLALTGVVGLNLASERVSFTSVIEQNSVLRSLDELGRPSPGRPADER